MMLRIACIRAGIGAFLAVATTAPLEAQSGAADDSVRVVQAGREWLHQLDRGEYEAAFASAAPLLREMAGSPDEWREFVRIARPDLRGDVRRHLVTSRPDVEMPVAPPGRYWSLVWEVAGGREVVVLFEEEGSWRVAMYSTIGLTAQSYR